MGGEQGHIGPRQLTVDQPVASAPHDFNASGAKDPGQTITSALATNENKNVQAITLNQQPSAWNCRFETSFPVNEWVIILVTAISSVGTTISGREIRITS